MNILKKITISLFLITSLSVSANFSLDSLKDMKIDKAQITKMILMLRDTGKISPEDAKKAIDKLKGYSQNDIDKMASKATGLVDSQMKNGNLEKMKQQMSVIDPSSKSSEVGKEKAETLPKEKVLGSDGTSSGMPSQN